MVRGGKRGKREWKNGEGKKPPAKIWQIQHCSLRLLFNRWPNNCSNVYVACTTQTVHCTQSVRRVKVQSACKAQSPFQPHLGAFYTDNLLMLHVTNWKATADKLRFTSTSRHPTQKFFPSPIAQHSSVQTTIINRCLTVILTQYVYIQCVLTNRQFSLPNTCMHIQSTHISPLRYYR